MYYFEYPPEWFILTMIVLVPAAIIALLYWIGNLFWPDA